MKIAAILLDILIILVTSYAFLKNYRVRKNINGFCGFSMGYCWYYGIMPVLITMLDWRGYNKSQIILSLEALESIDYLMASIIALVAYLVLYVMYSSVRGRGNTPGKETAKEHRRNVQLAFNIARNTGIITLIIGVISFSIIINELGGVRSALGFSDTLRAYSIDNGEYISRNLLFLRTMAAIICAAPFAFYIANQYRPGTATKALFAISFTLTLYYLIFNAGRGPILMLLIPFCFIYIQRKFRRPLILTGISGVIVLLLLFYMDNLFFYITYGIWKENTLSIHRLVAEFSFPYINLLNVQRMVDLFGYRYGADYLTWMVNIIPVYFLYKIGMDKLPASFEYTSDFYDPSHITLGGVPTDVVTLGFRQFGVTGVVMQFILIAVLCALLDQQIGKLYKSGKCLLGIVVVSITVFWSVAYADLDSLVRGKLDVFVIMVMLALIAHSIRNHLDVER